MTMFLIAGGYFVAVIAALLLTPVSIRLARKIGVVDQPHARKVHAAPMPRLGGLAIAAALLIGAIPMLVVMEGQGFGYLERTQIGMLLIAGTMVMLIGLVDDIWTLRPMYKLLGLFAAAAAVCGTGARIDEVVVHGQTLLVLGWLSWPVSLLWLVGVAVCVNFIDGLDGLAAGLTAIAAGALAFVAVGDVNPATSVMVLALLGSLTGFLVFNFNPARVFMGDSGAMFIGFILAGSCLLSIKDVGVARGVMVPALALSVPIVDGMWALLRRKVLQRRSMFSAERGHIHHELLNLGLCQRHAVLVLYGVSIVAAGVGLLSLLNNRWATIGGLALLAPLLVGLFRGAGSMRLRKTIAAVRRNRSLGKGSQRDRHAFEEMQLGFALADDFGAWWDQVCASASSLGFCGVTLPLVHRDGSKVDYRWYRPAEEGLADAARDPAEQTLQARVPIRQRRENSPLEAEVVLPAEPCLESAGRRLALFARLMEEFNPAGLPDPLTLARRRPTPANSAPASSNSASSAPANSAPVAKAPVHAAAPAHTNGHAEPASPPLDGYADRADAPDHDEDQDHEPNEAGAELAVTSVASPASPHQDQLRRITPGLRVAVVHDFLYTYAGAERVLEQIVNLFPDADLFSLFDFLPEDERGFIRNKPVTTSLIQRLPLAKRKHRAYLPLMPFAIEQMDVSKYDLVVSSSYLAAKGVITRPDALHVCYCHTPVRFAWDLQHQYLGTSGMSLGPRSLLARLVLHYLRTWDARSANGVDLFVSNSAFVGKRIRKVYRRDSTVVYPPVDVDRFMPSEEKGAFYVTASRLVQYKRIDAIVEAFNQMPDRRLIVVGGGPDLEKLRALAQPNITFVGHQPFERLRVYIQMAKAFIFAAEEDFGIVPVEAQACGTPVIAYGRGGVTESVLRGRTGVFFPEQTPQSIARAVGRFEETEHELWSAGRIRAHAERFSPHQFRERFAQVVLEKWLATEGEKQADAGAEPRVGEAMAALTPTTTRAQAWPTPAARDTER